jgi:hypothetical protein
MYAAYRLLQDAWIEAIADRLLPTSAQGQTAAAVATPVEEPTLVPSRIGI